MAKNIEQKNINKTFNNNGIIDFDYYLFEFSPDGIILVDEKGLIKLVNSQAENIFGYAREELIDKPIEILLPDKIKNIHLKYRNEYITKPIKRNMGEGIELFGINKQQIEIPLEISLNYFNTNNSLMIYCAIRDISEKYKIGKKISETQKNLSLILKNVSNVVYMLNVNNKIGMENIEFIGEKIIDLFGFNQDEFINDHKLLYDCVYPEDQANFLKVTQSLYINKKEITRLYRIKHNINGNIIWIKDKINPLLDENKNIINIFGVLSDITERINSEEKIRQQAALLDVTQDAIIVLDLEEKIIYWNKGAEKIYGWIFEDVSGKHLSEIIFKDGHITEAAEIAKTLKMKDYWRGEINNINNKGKEIIVESTWTLMKDSKNLETGKLIVNTDITQQKYLQNQFMRSQRMESLGSLASGIAHDLNNVLTPILLSLEMLKIKLPDEKSQKLLNTLQKTTLRGKDIIHQVLSFGKGMDGERTIVNLIEIINEVENIIKETFPKSINLETNIPQGSYSVLGDYTQIHQIIMNLCVNARDAMPYGGKIIISVEKTLIDDKLLFKTKDNFEPGIYIVISVNDSGSGIPHDLQERIFDPFFTTKEIGKGTGLGLSMVYNITKSHSGFINLYSELGKGTTFKVYLPYVQTVQFDQVEEVKEKILLNGNGEKILLIDDEESILEITREMFENYGYEVLVAGNGADGIALFANNSGRKIDLVITDMNMPIIGGNFTIAILKKIDPNLKIIFTSGMDTNFRNITENDNLRGILKPFTSEQILKLVKEILK